MIHLFYTCFIIIIIFIIIGFLSTKHEIFLVYLNSSKKDELMRKYKNSLSNPNKVKSKVLDIILPAEDAMLFSFGPKNLFHLVI